MTPQAKAAIEVADLRWAELAAAARNEQVRVKLDNLHEVCRVLVVEAEQRPTVPEVVRRYKARYVAREQSLAEQSLRNKRGGANPYAILYEAWRGAAEVILASDRRRRPLPSDSELLSADEASRIADTAMRHRVGLVISQNRSLKAQLDILKSLGNAPTVKLLGHGQDAAGAPLANHLALSATEIEALEDFIDARRLRARGLTVGDDGAIETLDGRPFSEPGFVDAVRKIVESHKV